MNEIDLRNHKHIHCVGIGGIGLSAIAEILLSKGYKVSGSDIKRSPVTDKLKADGAEVFIGHNPSNLGDCDLLVYSAAVGTENSEIAEALARGIPVLTRAMLLGAMMDDYGISIAIAGTHGKTTTTSMVSLVLEKASLKPTILVGGVLSEFKGNVKVGDSEYFVTEACEYMDSFLQLRPRVEIILNIDSDHLDYFKDIDHIAKSFAQFAESVPENGFVVAYDANPFVRSIIGSLKCRVITFGFSETSDYYAKDISFDHEGRVSYDMYHDGKFLSRMQLSLPGEHNVANSLAAAATCVNLGVSFDVIKETLESFTGTQRRFDLVGKTEGGVSIIDDYAHHPTEVKATLAAASRLAHNRIWCLFQPHTYTRVMALFDQFVAAFADADIVVLAEIYAAREKNIYKLSSKKLMDEIKAKHPEKEIYFIPDFNEMAEFVNENAVAGDVVFTMGAGDIYKIGDKILKKGR